MSFGALSEEAKLALATGAERAGTGICSWEGGMRPEEQAANSRYLFELGPARICHTNRCPAGIATQDPQLRRRLEVEHAAQRLERFLQATVALIQVLARACGHDHLRVFSRNDLASWHREVADLAGIAWSGSAQDAPVG